MITEDERLEIERFINHMLSQTARLIECDSSHELTGLASGFWIKNGESYRIISAGHAIGSSANWKVETVPVSATHTLALSVTNVQKIETYNLHGSLEEIDLAWADIDLAGIADQLEKDEIYKSRKPRIPIPIYTGPLDAMPESGIGYGFAAWNRAELHPAISTLRREASFEVYLEFLGMDPVTGLCRFGLSRDYQGNEYYQGASGAPIADPEGRYVSMLVAGDPDTKVLYGVPLASYASALHIES